MINNLKNIFKGEKEVIQDDFIKRIRSLVIGEGMLHEGNIPLMEIAIRDMPEEGSVVEIGSYGGLSANLIIYLLNKYKRKNPFFNCDAWIYEGYKDANGSIDKYIDGRDDILRSDYSEYMKNAYINATKFLNPFHLPHSFHMRSDLFFEKWKRNDNETDLFDRNVPLGGPVSFAYIDGGHSFDVAWNDFVNLSLHLKHNGYILLDDSADHLNFGSSEMMNKIKKDKRFKIVAKNPNYLIQKTEF